MGDIRDADEPTGQEPTGAGESADAPSRANDDGRIRYRVDLAVSRARAWEAYVHGLGEWWPQSATASGTGLDRIEVDPQQGGRIVEHARDGSATVWGAVTDAVPGERFHHTFALFHAGAATEVALSFEDLPQGGTRVTYAQTVPDACELDGRAKRIDPESLLERFRAYAQHV